MLSTLTEDLLDLTAVTKGSSRAYFAQTLSCCSCCCCCIRKLV